MHARHSFAALALLASLSSATIVARQGSDVDGYHYTSCQKSADFTGFSVQEDADDMNVDECTAVCGGDSGYDFLYAAVSGSQCMCGTTFSTGSIAPSSQDAQCNTPCPGDDTETCGGSGLWSLYTAQVAADSSDSAGAASTSAVDDSAPTTVPSKGTGTMTVPTSTKTATVSALSTPASGSSTLTIYSTKVFTITSCAPTVTNCPASHSTTLIPISTTVVPAGVTPSKAAPVASSNATTSAIKTVSTAASVNSTAKATATSTPTTFTGAAIPMRVENFGFVLSLVGLLAFL